MKCVICEHGLERGGMTLAIKGVPADVCTTCGEQYVGEEAAARVLREAEAAARAGVQVDVRAYAA